MGKSYTEHESYFSLTKNNHDFIIVSKSIFWQMDYHLYLFLLQIPWLNYG